MTDTEIIIEITKLDDIMYEWCAGLQQNAYYSKLQKIWYPNQTNIPYLTSRDAIVPVVEKCITNPDIEHTFNYALYDSLPKEDWDKNAMTYVMAVKATARQLCIALLKATGKWKE